MYYIFKNEFYILFKNVIDMNIYKSKKENNYMQIIYNHDDENH